MSNAEYSPEGRIPPAKPEGNKHAWTPERRAKQEATLRAKAAASSPAEPAPVPNRRAEEVATSRRRRQDFGGLPNMKLAVHEGAKDPNYEYRIINDKPGRIHQKTVMDDWDIVKTTEMNGHVDYAKQAGEGTPMAFMAGSMEGGAPMKAYLCRKPKQFYEEDKGKEQAVIDAKEESIKRGIVKGPEGQGLPQEVSYVPGGKDGMSGSNTIRRGR